MDPGLPLVAVFYEPGAFAPLAITEAARGGCSLLWVIDDEFAVDRVARSLLRRLGPVVDITGLSAPAAARLLAESGVAGVVAFSDPMLVRTAEVAETMHLPFHRRAVALRLRDKALQRAALAAADVPTPGFVSLPRGLDPAETASRLASLQCPVVVKPARGTGSRDVEMVGSPDILMRVVAAAAEDLVVEGYLADLPPTDPIARDAAEHGLAGVLSVESVVRHGVIRHLFITGRFAFVPPLLETGSFLPYELPAATEAAVYDVAGSALRALGVEDGMTHTEIKLTPLGPRIVEVNGRIGGGVPQLVTATGGPDLISWNLRLALGDELEDAVPPRDGVAFFMWERPPLSAARVDRLEGIDELSELPGVRTCSVTVREGDDVSWHATKGATVMALEGWAPSPAALHGLRREIAATFRVGYLDAD